MFGFNQSTSRKRTEWTHTRWKWTDFFFYYFVWMYFFYLETNDSILENVWKWRRNRFIIIILLQKVSEICPKFTTKCPKLICPKINCPKYFCPKFFDDNLSEAHGLINSRYRNAGSSKQGNHKINVSSVNVSTEQFKCGENEGFITIRGN
mgnify:CR=1 FL=1